MEVSPVSCEYEMLVYNPVLTVKILSWDLSFITGMNTPRNGSLLMLLMKGGLLPVTLCSSVSFFFCEPTDMENER